MKNLLLLSLIILGLTSCSKDSLDITNDLVQGPDKSEIMVSVGYLTYSGSQCEPGCGESAQIVNHLPNALVVLFAGSETDALNSPLVDMRTDKDGSALLTDLEPATYTVLVDTEMGIKSRTIHTVLKKRTYIDFNF